jgi:serine/threonine protein kinase
MKRADEIIQAFKMVNGNIKIEERVGGGSFGDVFIGRDIDTGLKYAVKFEKKCQYVYQTLPKEAKVLSIMESCHGYAQLHSVLSENGFNILIMNLLGPNLEKLFKFCDSSPFITR